MEVPELVIWDMDGTLIDSASVVPDSFIATAAKFGGADSSRDEVVALYSLGVPENMLERMLGRVPDQEVMEHFYSVLREGSRAVSVYDGIPECLTELAADTKLAVFTGASRRSARILLESVRLDSVFDLILGGDNFPPKPDPAGLLGVASHFGIPRDRCVYIGDAPSDMKAASSAEMRAIGAGWGHLFSPDSDPRPDRVARQPDDVPGMIRMPSI